MSLWSSIPQHRNRRSRSWQTGFGWPTRSCCLAVVICRRVGMGRIRYPTLGGVDEDQDAFDLAMARWAISKEIPLLAICRGNQVVNVALGGSLVQDMTEAKGRAHRGKVHDIELADDSPLREVVSDDRITISCSHHQCIDRLGDNLLPAAYAADGTIEAVTLTGHEGWFLGVQWHLEDFADTDPRQRDIFRALIAAAR